MDRESKGRGHLSPTRHRRVGLFHATAFEAFYSNLLSCLIYMHRPDGR